MTMRAPRTDILAAQIAQLLATYPELRDDPILRADTLEGETDFVRVCDRIVKAIAEREAFESAGRETAAEFTAAARRHAEIAERLRGVLLDLLLAADMTTLRLPAGGTVRVGQSKPSPSVQDAAAVPEALCTVTPSLAAIRKFIADEGVTPPGVVMSNGAPFIRITK